MTSLPIDCSKRPWRPKYLFDETLVLNSWFVFGEYPDGTVGISDGNNDIMERVPRDVANAICEARDVFLGVVAQHLCRSGAES